MVSASSYTFIGMTHLRKKEQLINLGMVLNHINLNKVFDVSQFSIN